MNSSSQRLFWAVAGLWLGLLAAKLVLAATLELHYDEGYYWIAAEFPALVYPDKPGLTPLLVAAGRWLLGDTLLGARAPFLTLGALVPVAVYALARQVSARREALTAAGLAMLLPLGALLGLNAFHDTPMVLAMLVAAAAFARALRDDALWPWPVLGAACAVGLLTHYRFVTLPAAIVVFMLLAPSGRRLWRRPGPWVAAAIGVLGALPTLWFVIEVGADPLRYHFIDRNPWRFQPKGLRFTLEQAAVTTPLLFAALIAALLLLARRRDAVAAWLATAGAVMAGIYFLLTPFADLDHATAHWPLPGYLVLLAGVPAVLGKLGHWRWLVPATAGLGTLAMLGYVAAAAWPERLFTPLTQRLIADHEIVAWERLVPVIDAHREQAGVLVVGHYRPAGALARLYPDLPVYVLEHELNWQNGYGASFAHWRRDETGLLADHAGAEALIVLPVPDFAYHDTEEIARLAHLCTVFGNLRDLGETILPADRHAVRLLAGVIGGFSSDCPALPRHYLARPKRGERVDGRFEVLGWAMDEAGVAGADVLIDGQAQALRYGDPWPERLLRPGLADPNRPRVGFHAWLDAADLRTGRHKVEIRLTYADGRRHSFGARRIFVER
ncbi:MAG: glycosyltransferase family 39 protein [Alphaproteobacteria bacterium]